MTSLESADTSSMQAAALQEYKPTNIITDMLKQTDAVAATATTTTTIITTNTTSNIETPLGTPTSSLCGSPKATTRIPHPHPLPHPVATLLADAAAVSPFQRSASMRMRGIKSNSPLDETTTGNDSDNNKNKNKNNGNELCRSVAAAAAAAVNTPTCRQLPHDCDLTSSAGFSTRRKVALRSSPTRALHQTVVSQHLSRSLSLHRNYKNSGHKTATPKDCGKVQTLPLCAPKTNLNASAVNKSACNHHMELCNDTTAIVNEDNEDNRAAAHCESGDSGNSHEANQAKRNMSLNLNGCDTSNTTTTTTATTTATTTTKQQATGNDIVEAASASVASTASTAAATTSTPKSPKTTLPIQITTIKAATTSTKTTTPASSVSLQHSCGRQVHCTKAANKLSTVLETKLSPRTPPVTPDSPSTYLDDDLDSMYSFATTTSGRSTMSCEHPYVARNGTTFSGRKMKYVVHCSNYAGQVGADYLTPTQRAQRQIKRLKELLCIARQDLEQKDSEILRLTREVVELRLFKASLSSPEERSASSDAVTVREAELKTSQDVSPIVDMVDDAQKASPRHLARQQLQATDMNSTPTSSMQISSEMQSSFADSGHFEDITTSSVHSKDSHTHDIACGSDAHDLAGTERGSPQNLENYELQRQELIRLYEQRIEELIRTQDGATSDLKRSHNDKVEALLQKLAECNTRYADIVPDYEHAKERIRELEKQLEDLQRKLLEHEEKQNKMYLHMYQKGQEAERLARADQALELAHRNPDNKVSINELLHQLQSTQDELENIRAAECRKNECGSNHALLTAKEAISLWVLGARKTIYRRLMEAQKNRTHVDPEVTLQFLKSAVYYFLTDKENSQGHLQAIESILQFTETEKQNISKAWSPK